MTKSDRKEVIYIAGELERTNLFGMPDNIIIEKAIDRLRDLSKRKRTGGKGCKIKT